MFTPAWCVQAELVADCKVTEQLVECCGLFKWRQPDLVGRWTDTRHAADSDVEGAPCLLGFRSRLFRCETFGCSRSIRGFLSGIYKTLRSSGERSDGCRVRPAALKRGGLCTPGGRWARHIRRPKLGEVFATAHLEETAARLLRKVVRVGHPDDGAGLCGRE